MFVNYEIAFVNIFVIEKKKKKMRNYKFNWMIFFFISF